MVSSSPSTTSTQSSLDRFRERCRPLLLPVFSLAQLLDALNLSGANVALPEIAQDLGFSTSNLQWVISAYALTFGGFLLLTGRLGDIYGHRNFFVAGLVWFTVFAVLAGFSQSTTWMIVARGLQGIGAASTIPNAIALILQVYPIGRSRNQAMSVFASTGAIGFVLGLIIGGAVTSSALGWRWIFFFSAIISGTMAVIGGVVIPGRPTAPASHETLSSPSLASLDAAAASTKDAAAAAAPRISKDTLPPPTTSTPVRQTVDYLGALLSTASMLLLVFVLTDANSRGWDSPMIISLLIVSFVLLGAFVLVELRVRQPLMPMHIWWNLPNFAPAFLIATCLVGFFQAYLYFITLIFSEVMHYTAMQTAVRYLPLGIVASVMGIMSEKIIFRFNIKVALVLGLALGTIGNVIIGFYDRESQYWSLVFTSFVIGCTGLSTVYASVSICAISAAPAELAGVVGGLLNTAFQIGGGLGLAITTAVASSVNGASTVKRGHDLMAGYHAGLWTATGMVGLALVVAIVFVRAPSAPPLSSDKEEEVMQEVMVVTAAGTVQGLDDRLEPALSHATLNAAGEIELPRR